MPFLDRVFTKPALHRPAGPGWSGAVLPPDFVPVALDERLGPLDPAALTAMAEGPERILLVAPAEAVLHPDIANVVRRALAERPDAAIFYGDEILIGAGDALTTFCKPAFNRALLESTDYIGFPLILRASALKAIDLTVGWRREGAWYELVLQAAAAGLAVARIPRTLQACAGPRREAPIAARRKVLVKSMDRLQADVALLPGRVPASLRTQRRFADHPDVTLIVSGKHREMDQALGLARILEAIRRGRWPADRLEVLVADGADVAPGRGDPIRLREVPLADRSSSARLNGLWRAAETDFIVFLDDDLEPGTPDWLDALVNYAADRSVGVVGARTIDRAGRVVQAGLVGDPEQGLCALWRGQPASAPTYGDWALLPRDCAMVGGGILATRRAVLDAANGFDPGFSGLLAEADLCLRTGLLGYRTVYTPFAEFVRPAPDDVPVPGSEIARFVRRWRDVLYDDPGSNPQLRVETGDLKPFASATRWVEDLRNSKPA
ncbi:glycosyltransferase [Methylobacterium nigriterrae]|uniref:glycosyltransferase n=1 Tax=Methylobacterium nigriterrae TaxID=3127512 RepID=UPI003013202D